MLKINDLSTCFGPTHALDGINLNIHHGEIVALIGLNGVGKTTLLSTISGILTSRHGQVFFDDKPISHLGANAIVQLGISHVPERRQVFSTMNVRDNVLLGAYHRRGQAVRRYGPGL